MDSWLRYHGQWYALLVLAPSSGVLRVLFMMLEGVEGLGVSTDVTWSVTDSGVAADAT